ncbi:MAG: hypothetical protein M1125_00385 [Candidatus Marsarchaeota archaeon]|nr:hypothetical protein [Candidatus Marsarchaeota archaeon]
MPLEKADMEQEHKCLLCGHSMLRMQACHLKCPNCGAEMDCSDKGFIW